VGAPGHVANDVYSGLPHLDYHRGHLPIFKLESLLDLTFRMVPAGAPFS
jgi:hypothetical protein